MAEGRMPLGVKKVRKASAQKSKDMNSKKAALRLIQFGNDLFPNKLSIKQKKEKNELIKFDASGEPILNNAKNKDTADMGLDMDVSAVDSENDLTDSAATMKINAQKSSANVPSKKRKRSISIHDESAKEQEFSENPKKKSKTKISAKSNKKINLKCQNNTHAVHKSANRKIKATPYEQISHNEDQCTSLITSVTKSQKRLKTNKLVTKKPVSKDQKRLKSDKLVIKKPVLKINASRGNRVTPLKTVSVKSF